MTNAPSQMNRIIGLYWSAHAPGLIAERIAERDEDVTVPARINARLRHRALLYEVSPFLRPELGDERTILANVDFALPAPGSWGPGRFSGCAIRIRIPRPRRDLPTLRLRSASTANAETTATPSTNMPTPKCAIDMPSTPRVMPTAPFSLRAGPNRLDERRGHDPHGGNDADDQQDAAAAIDNERNRDAQHHGDDGRHFQHLHQGRRRLRAPRRVHAEADQQHEREHRHHECQVEPRRSDGNLAAGEEFDDQRRQRAAEYQCGRDDQQDTLFSSRKVSRDNGRKPASESSDGCPPGVQRQRAADDDRRGRPG